MLTEAQVAKARTLPGCNDLTAENAVDKLFAASESLQNIAANAASQTTALDARVKTLETDLATARAAAPVATPPAVLKAMASAARVFVDDAKTKQSATPACVDALASSLIGTDESLSAVGLTPTASGSCVAIDVFRALATNGAAPNVGKSAGTQQAPKVAAGAPEDDPKKVTDDARAEAKAFQDAQLAARGMK